MSLLGRGIDFNLDHKNDMDDTLDLIAKCDLPNKSEMFHITLYSFARTISSHFEDTAKEFIRAIYKINHLHVMKLINEMSQNPSKDLDEVIITEISGISRKGMGCLDFFINRFFSVISKKEASRFIEYKKSHSVLKKFVRERNNITHEFGAKNESFIFVIENWGECTDYLAKTIREYTLGEGQKLLVGKIVLESQEIISNDRYLLDYLYPRVKKFMYL